MLNRLLSWLRAGPVTLAGTWRSPAAHSTLVHAGSAGPVLVVARGDPFGCGETELAAAAAAAMAAEMTAPVIRFTADPGQAPRPHIRVVVAFDPPPGLAAEDLCAGGAIAGSPGGALSLVAVFCNGERLLASATGRTARPASADDPRFRRLMGQVAHALFDETGA